jgi:hypothetical protein
MLLSSNVIKQVSYELENCSVQPRLKISRDAQDTTPGSVPGRYQSSGSPDGS